jgi:hypothetical protein
MLLVVPLVCMTGQQVAAEEENSEAYQPFGFWYKGYPKPTDLQKKVK